MVKTPWGILLFCGPRQFHARGAGEEAAAGGGRRARDRDNDAKGDLTIWHQDVAGFHVPTKIHEVVQVKGQVLSDLTIRCKDHEIKLGLPKKKPSEKDG